ncbi:MAG: zinc ribbon domain-containing protein [Peptostreptococcaceae bacterium]|jgi:hypothetical protein|nr:zinc ribbon domain-containing protein [Peptostreptococcaceae bacterium]
MSKFFKSIKKNIHKKVANVSTKSYTAIEASKIKGYISNLEEQRDVLVCELGKKIYQLSKKNELDLETIKENCDFIKEFDRKIDLQFEKLRLIKLEEQEILNSYNKKPQEFFNELNNENKNNQELKDENNIQKEDLNIDDINKDIISKEDDFDNLDSIKTTDNSSDENNILKKDSIDNNLDETNENDSDENILDLSNIDNKDSNKVTCIACSKLNDSNSNFCFNCGTKLEEDFD